MVHLNGQKTFQDNIISSITQAFKSFVVDISKQFDDLLESNKYLEQLIENNPQSMADSPTPTKITMLESQLKEQENEYTIELLGKICQVFDYMHIDFHQITMVQDQSSLNLPKKTR